MYPKPDLNNKYTDLSKHKTKIYNTSTFKLGINGKIIINGGTTTIRIDIKVQTPIITVEKIGIHIMDGMVLIINGDNFYKNY